MTEEQLKFAYTKILKLGSDISNSENTVKNVLLKLYEVTALAPKNSSFNAIISGEYGSWSCTKKGDGSAKVSLFIPLWTYGNSEMYVDTCGYGRNGWDFKTQILIHHLKSGDTEEVTREVRYGKDLRKKIKSSLCYIPVLFGKLNSEIYDAETKMREDEDKLMSELRDSDTDVIKRVKITVDYA